MCIYTYMCIQHKLYTVLEQEHTHTRTHLDPKDCMNTTVGQSLGVHM